MEMPQERVKQLWSYEPCPITKNYKGEPEPPVPSSWMLHLWNYPDHTVVLGESTPMISSLFSRTSPRDTPQAADPERQNERRDSIGPSRAAVLTTTPKQLGSGLTVPCAGNEFPKLWGLYCEEGFRVSWIFFAILLVYLSASLAFAVAWYVEHGTGPQAGLGSFGVASWMVSLLALSITAWFAAVKD